MFNPTNYYLDEISNLGKVNRRKNLIVIAKRYMEQNK